ncbi:MAG: DNA gyrase subunit A [Anaerolineales bacterium]|nr:DNA gyrase subunit A [Anaerolineales bacterium]
MPRRKRLEGQLPLLGDDLPEDPYGIMTPRTGPAARSRPVPAADPPELLPPEPAPKPTARPTTAASTRGAAGGAPARPRTPAARVGSAAPRPLSAADRLAALYSRARGAEMAAPMALLADVSYRDYAVAVVTDRAVPDVRDGLKPVQRRILYDMLVELGLDSRGPHKKSARIVGDVLGKFHPHGDQAVYDAMARMAQDFSLRLPLVDGQGNFGSADGDSPAAMRYTEARLSLAGELMLDGIRSDTVDYGDNFDGSLKEPLVLPTALPNLLVNGASGIAVGMASNIPPHNLAEVCAAVVFVARHWEARQGITVDQLMRHIPGPDFPTGGQVYRYRPDPRTGEVVDVIRQAYATGRSTLVVSAACEIAEIGGGKSEIAVMEVPYQVTRGTIKDRIADDRERFRAAGVSSVSDLSDRHGMRLVFETVRGVDPPQVLRFLLDNTKLSTSLPYGAVALVKNERGELEPRQCALKEMLEHFVAFRLEVIERRARHDLARAEERLHLVLGLLKAIRAIDEVIRIIRGSADADEARARLMKRLAIDEVQAVAILDMQLRRLARLEFKKLDDERRELEARIKDLRAILASQARRLELVVSETQAVKAKFATPRRTRIIETETGHKGAVPETGPAAPAGPQVVIIGPEAARCQPAQDYAEAAELGRPGAKPAEVVLQRLSAPPNAALLLVSSSGQLWKGSVARLAAGVAPAGDRLVFGGLAQTGQYLVLGTRRGNVKRVKIEDASVRPDNAWSLIIGLEGAGDEVLFAGVGGDDTHVFFCTAGGAAGDARVLRFEAGNVNPQATPSARGVAGIKLEGGLLVAGGVFVPGDHDHLVVLSTNGFIKRMPLAEFPVQGRGGQGVMVLRVTPATGPVADAAYAPPGSTLGVFATTNEGLWLKLTEVEQARRPATGSRLRRQTGRGKGFSNGAMSRVIVLPPL